MLAEYMRERALLLYCITIIRLIPEHSATFLYVVPLRKPARYYSSAFDKLQDKDCFFVEAYMCTLQWNQPLVELPFAFG